MSSALDLEKGIAETNIPPQGMGQFHVNSTTPYVPTSVAPPPKIKIATGAALGFFCFASSTFMLSLYSIQTRSITHPNVVVGAGLWCGGIAQICAGMWEFPRGNAFGATAFISYGTFWLSYVTILIPGSGILAAYGDNTAELSSAIGIFFLAWAIFTAFLGLAALNKNWTLVFLLDFLVVDLVVFAVGEFAGSAKITKVGGYMGMIVAATSWYIAFSELLDSDPNPPFRLPMGIIKSRKRD